MTTTATTPAASTPTPRTANAILEWAWTARTATLEDRLTLVALANSRHLSPSTGITVIGMRALREMAMLRPVDLDMVLTGLERDGFITRVQSDPTTDALVGSLESTMPGEGPWHAWRLNQDKRTQA